MTAEQERRLVEALETISGFLVGILWEIRSQNEEQDRCGDCHCPAIVEEETFNGTIRGCMACGTREG